MTVKRVFDDAIDRYVAWREECDVVRDAYERWRHASGPDAAWAFAEYQAALDREGHIAEVYGNLMARAAQAPSAADRVHRNLVACMTLAAAILSVVIGTGRI